MRALRAGNNDYDFNAWTLVAKFDGLATQPPECSRPDLLTSGRNDPQLASQAAADAFVQTAIEPLKTVLDINESVLSTDSGCGTPTFEADYSALLASDSERSSRASSLPSYKSVEIEDPGYDEIPIYAQPIPKSLRKRAGISLTRQHSVSVPPPPPIPTRRAMITPTAIINMVKKWKIDPIMSSVLSRRLLAAALTTESSFKTLSADEVFRVSKVVHDSLAATLPTAELRSWVECRVKPVVWQNISSSSAKTTEESFDLDRAWLTIFENVKDWSAHPIWVEATSPNLSYGFEKSPQIPASIDYPVVMVLNRAERIIGLLEKFPRKGCPKEFLDQMNAHIEKYRRALTGLTDYLIILNSDKIIDSCEAFLNLDSPILKKEIGPILTLAMTTRATRSLETSKISETLSKARALERRSKAEVAMKKADMREAVGKKTLAATNPGEQIVDAYHLYHDLLSHDYDWAKRDRFRETLNLAAIRKNGQTDKALVKKLAVAGDFLMRVADEAKVDDKCVAQLNQYLGFGSSSFFRKRRKPQQIIKAITDVLYKESLLGKNLEFQIPESSSSLDDLHLRCRKKFDRFGKMFILNELATYILKINKSLGCPLDNLIDVQAALENMGGHENLCLNDLEMSLRNFVATKHIIDNENPQLQKAKSQRNKHYLFYGLLKQYAEECARVLHKRR